MQTRKMWQKILSFGCVFAMLLTTCCAVDVPFIQTAAAAEAYAVEADSPATITVNGKSVKVNLIDNGDTLAEVAANMMQQNYEISCGFNQQGQKLFEVTSYLPTQVFTTSTQRKAIVEQGGIIAHSHPSSNSFSGQDLRSAAQYNLPRTMAIGAKYVYTLEPTEAGWGEPDDMYNYWYERYAVYGAEADEFFNTYKLSVDKILSLEDTPDDGSLEWFCNMSAKEILQKNPNAQVSIETGQWISHHVLLDVAEKFQMEYHRYETAKFDFNNPAVFITDKPDVPKQPNTATEADNAGETSTTVESVTPPTTNIPAATDSLNDKVKQNFTPFAKLGWFFFLPSVIII